MTGTEQSEDIRRAGGIPPLVAMLNSNTAPHIEMAAAMALTHVSQASEVNRVAIRKANGFQPLIALAAQSQRNGTMKYTAAITSLALAQTAKTRMPSGRPGIPSAGRSPPNGPDSKTTCDAIAALRHLTYGNTPNCNSLREASGIHWIVSLLQAGPDRLAAVTRLRRYIRWPWIIRRTRMPSVRQVNSPSHITSHRHSRIRGSQMGTEMSCNDRTRQHYQSDRHMRATGHNYTLSCYSW